MRSDIKESQRIHSYFNRIVEHRVYLAWLSICRWPRFLLRADRHFNRLYLVSYKEAVWVFEKVISVA